MHEQARDFGIGTDKFREMMNMKMDIFAAQIRKLSELHEEGLLTEEEFSTAKAKLLGQL
jgi:hypothetical protein